MHAKGALLPMRGKCYRIGQNRKIMKEQPYYVYWVNGKGKGVVTMSWAEVDERRGSGHYIKTTDPLLAAKLSKGHQPGWEDIDKIRREEKRREFKEYNKRNGMARLRRRNHGHK